MRGCGLRRRSCESVELILVRMAWHGGGLLRVLALCLNPNDATKLHAWRRESGTPHSHIMFPTDTRSGEGIMKPSNDTNPH
jgi:hypothetical protein